MAKKICSFPLKEKLCTCGFSRLVPRAGHLSHFCWNNMWLHWCVKHQCRLYLHFSHGIAILCHTSFFRDIKRKFLHHKFSLLKLISTLIKKPSQLKPLLPAVSQCPPLLLVVNLTPPHPVIILNPSLLAVILTPVCPAVILHPCWWSTSSIPTQW